MRRDEQFASWSSGDGTQPVRRISVSKHPHLNLFQEQVRSLSCVSLLIHAGNTNAPFTGREWIQQLAISRSKERRSIVLPFLLPSLHSTSTVLRRRRQSRRRRWSDGSLWHHRSSPSVHRQQHFAVWTLFTDESAKSAITGTGAVRPTTATFFRRLRSSRRRVCDGHVPAFTTATGGRRGNSPTGSRAGAGATVSFVVVLFASDRQFGVFDTRAAGESE